MYTCIQQADSRGVINNKVFGLFLSPCHNLIHFLGYTIQAINIGVFVLINLTNGNSLFPECTLLNIECVHECTYWGQRRWEMQTKKCKCGLLFFNLTICYSDNYSHKYINNTRLSYIH